MNLKKVEVDRVTFYWCTTALTFISWAILSAYTDVPALVLFFPVFIFFYVLVRLCVHYVVDLR